jgi:hypothetical protein
MFASRNRDRINDRIELAFCLGANWLVKVNRCNVLSRLQPGRAIARWVVSQGGKAVRAACAAALAFLLTACNERGSAAPVRTTFVYSLGVPHAVTLASALLADTFATVAARPRLTLGGGDQDAHQLFRVRAAVFVDSTTLAVLNAGSWQVRFYGLNGQLRAASAGRGNGPGELMEPSGILRISPNEIVVWDAQKISSTVFGIDGASRSTMSAHFGRAGSDLRGLLQMRPLARWVQVAPDKLLLFAYQPFDGPPPERFRQPVSYVLSNFDFTQLDTLGKYGGLEQARVGRGERSPILPMVHGRDTYYASSPDMSSVYVGDNNAFRVQRFGMDGKLELVIRVDSVNEPATSAHLAEGRALVADVLREYGFPSPDSLAAQAAVASTLPTFRGLTVDTEGRLWVRRTTTGRGTNTRVPYVVFDESGAFLGSVSLPRHDRILSITGNRLVLLRRTDLDVEEIEVYEFSRK